ncbi:MAG: amidase [Acidimicrobiia bacterium]|nr:amidase [Acidimicrobiia bacterium]
MADELAALDATAQAALVRSGETTAAELVDAAIARVEAVNGRLNAVITPLFEQARRAATDAASGFDGPFGGVPFLMKDLMSHTAGDRYCAGMPILKELDYRPAHDTELAARFKRAGLISLGKTNTPEWGSLPTTEPLAFGATHNPWDLGRSPAGSSGGSAAAVAAGVVAMASGGDGGGSIRVPASACGIFGLKPSRGRVPCGPDHGEVWAGFAAEGVLTRTVRDTAAALDAIAGPATGDPNVAPAAARPYAAAVGADPGRLRVGVMTVAPGQLCDVDADCVVAASDAAALLAELGHHVEVAHPDALDEAAEFRRHFGAVVSSHAAADFAAWERTLGRKLQPGDIEPVDWAIVERAQARPLVRYLEAIDWIDSWRRRLCAWWERFDLLVTPTMAVPPVPLGTLVHTDADPLAGMKAAGPSIVFTSPFNASGQPAMSVPLFWNDGGLPIGTQVVAAPWREDVLLSVAAQLEAVRPWAGRRPPVWAGAPI